MLSSFFGRFRNAGHWLMTSSRTVGGPMTVLHRSPVTPTCALLMGGIPYSTTISPLARSLLTLSLTMLCWNCSSTFRSSSGTIPNTAQPQVLGRSSMALDRTEVNLHSLTNSLATSRAASRNDAKSLAIASAQRFVRPPEIPSRTGWGPVVHTSCGSRLTHLLSVSKSQVPDVAARTYCRSIAALTACSRTARAMPTSSVV